jgi:predicted O-linked N-acetylglucosamine transferase (SPINDLY family)
MTYLQLDLILIESLQSYKYFYFTNKFIYRLKQNLGKNFVNNNCLFHDKVSNKKFLELVNSSDIILDSMKWSGGISSLEAIYLNKPIVTLPSELLQSRHTYGILKILEKMIGYIIS